MSKQDRAAFAQGSRQHCAPRAVCEDDENADVVAIGLTTTRLKITISLGISVTVVCTNSDAFLPWMSLSPPLSHERPSPVSPHWDITCASA